MVLVHYGDDWEKNLTRVTDLGFEGLAKQWVFYDFPKLRKISGKE